MVPVVKPLPESSKSVLIWRAPTVVRLPRIFHWGKARETTSYQLAVLTLELDPEIPPAGSSRGF